jgi:hypothetical protein
MSKILTGLYSAIPSAAANTGAYYYATDTEVYWLADGDKWIQSTPSLDGWVGIPEMPGFQLPPYDGIVCSNFAAADKPRSILLKKGNNTVATLTITYDGSNNLTSIVSS